MSAYSDWKCGALSDDEYKQAYAHERGEDHGEIQFDDDVFDNLEDEESYLCELRNGYERWR